MKKYLCVLLSIIISMSAVCINIACYAAEEIVAVDISLDDNFADNRIIVVLNNESSASLKKYTLQDFDELNCKSIADLSNSSGNKVRAAMVNIADHVVYNDDLEPYDGVALGEYNQIFCLELETSGKANVITAIKKLMKRDDVLLAAPDYELVECGIEPTDPYYQTKMNSWAEHIGLEDAWDYAQLNFEYAPTVRVGIIDSGIDEDHPDLQDNLDIQSSANLTQDPLDENYDGGVVDDRGHGTMCASVVGAVANNGEGTAGVCWNVQLISLKVHDGQRYLSSYVADAIDYAEDNNIDILSMSLLWSIPANKTTYGSYDDALDYCISNYTGLFVCSAGNDNTNMDNSSDQELPGSYENLSRKIVVGSSNYDDISTFSNTGAETVDLFAQGEDILVAFPADKCSDGTHVDPNNPVTLNAHEYEGYHRSSGTSFAAPLVAGTAAIMLCMDCYLEPERIKSKILCTAVDPDNNFYGECISNGRLDVNAAVRSALETDTPEEPETCQHEGDVYYTQYNDSSHRVICDDCDEVIETVAHEGYNTNYGSSGHRFYCTVCEYSAMRDHDIYIYAVNNGVYTIKCHGCSYVKNCSCGCEFEPDGDMGHSLTCMDCNYSIFEAHNYGQYTDLENGNHSATCVDCGYTHDESHTLRRFMSTDLYTHNVECTFCDNNFTESHTWVSYGTGYRCSVCKMLSDSPPIIMSLPDPELEAYLASLSVEELEEFIASLPEDQVDRVTALLPSDDEHLTE